MSTNTTDTSTQPDLESRINARRTELIQKLVELKADTRIGAVETRDKLKAKLSELAHIIKEGVVDGWASLGDTAKHKLDHWLAGSALQPSESALQAPVSALQPSVSALQPSVSVSALQPSVPAKAGQS